MKVYLAARYSRHPEMQQYAKELEALGHTITSRWIYGGHDIATDVLTDAEHTLPQWAQEDYDDLVAADVCLSFTEPPGEAPGRSRGGRHVEHGIALALGKACVVVGERENIFHWLPTVIVCATWQEALRKIVAVQAIIADYEHRGPYAWTTDDAQAEEKPA